MDTPAIDNLIHAVAEDRETIAGAELAEALIEVKELFVGVATNLASIARSLEFISSK